MEQLKLKDGLLRVFLSSLTSEESGDCTHVGEVLASLQEMHNEVHEELT